MEGRSRTRLGLERWGDKVGGALRHEQSRGVRPRRKSSSRCWITTVMERLQAKRSLPFP